MVALPLDERAGACDALAVVARRYSDAQIGRHMSPAKLEAPAVIASPARRANSKGDEARKRLLEESVKLIGEQGLAGLSFREMARRANVSHQAPYHHFTNREGILAAIVLEGFTRLDAKLVEARTRHRREEPARVLREVLAAYMTFALKNPVHFRVMFRPDIVAIRDYPEARVQAMLAFQRLVDSVADCHLDADRTNERFVEVVNSLWAGAHGVATLVLDGPVHVNSPSLSFNGFIDTAAALFGEAGAMTKLVP
jgi:AcrR family transcriptional regulator